MKIVPDMNKRKLLLLTVNFPPNPTVGTRRVAKILKYLDYNKYEVFVLTLRADYYDAEQAAKATDAQKIPKKVRVYRTSMRDYTAVFTNLKNRIAGKMAKPKKSSRGSGIGQTKPPVATRQNTAIGLLYRLRTTLYSVLEFPDKYNGWAGKAIKKASEIIRDEKIDVLITTAPPHSLFPIAAAIKKKTSVKLVLDFRDPWALASWLDNSGWQARLKARLERKAICRADKVLFVTSILKDTYAKAYPDQAQNNFELFSNGFDPDDFKKELRVARQGGERVRMVHMGTLYKKRNPENLLTALRELVAEGSQLPPLQIDFIGPLTARFADLPEKVQKMGLGDYVRFQPPVDFDESIRYMYGADILLIIQPETMMQVPAKLFEYMYTQKPILAIAEPGSATELAIHSGKLGISAPSEDIAAIKKAILDILDFRARNQAPDNSYIEQFNYAEYIKRFESIIDKV